MKKLNWSNLQQNKCPYCAYKLLPVNELGFIECDNCIFNIEKKRFDSIKQNRNEGVRGIHMYWQNLRVSRCPACGDELLETSGNYEILKCIRVLCAFKIRFDRMQEILDDPTHPANKFHKR